jgi:hypothetical protein
MFAGIGLTHAKLRVLSATPMNHQDHLATRIVDVDDDLLDQRANKPLLGTHLCGGRVPNSLEIFRQR